MATSRNAIAVQPAPQPETATEPGLQAPEADTPDPTAMAIARCRAASKKALVDYVKIHGAKAVENYAAEKLAASAYRNAMPALSNRENIRAFIACVTDGVLIEVIQEDTSSRLLYAAQVALGGLPRESHHSISSSSQGEGRQPGRPVTNKATEHQD